MTNIVIFFAIIAIVFFAILSVFQFLLLIGLPWGHLAYGGMHDHEKLPNKLRIMSVVAIVIFTLAILSYIELAGIAVIFNNNVFVLVYGWIIAIYLTIGVLMNGASRSKLEKRIWTPFSLVGAICCYLVLFLT